MRFSWNETFINIAINNFISYWLEWTMECLVQPCCWNKLWKPFFIPFLQSSVSYKSPCSWGCLAVFFYRSIFLASRSNLSFIISTELAKSSRKQFRYTSISSGVEKEKDILKTVRWGVMLKLKSLFRSVKHSKKEKKETPLLFSSPIKRRLNMNKSSKVNTARLLAQI